jgi:hypothetical protein
MSTILLPRIDQEYMRHLMHEYVKRIDQPIPEQASIDAFMAMGSVLYTDHSWYHNVSAQLNFLDGTELVFRRTTFHNPVDASYEEIDSVVSVYDGDTLGGTLVHYKPNYGEGKWASDLAEAAIKKLEPYLEALNIYGWIHTYVIPHESWSEPGLKQLGFMNDTAFTFSEVLSHNIPPQKQGLRIITLPKLQDAHEDTIDFVDDLSA